MYAGGAVTTDSLLKGFINVSEKYKDSVFFRENEEFERSLVHQKLLISFNNYDELKRKV